MTPALGRQASFVLVLLAALWVVSGHAQAPVPGPREVVTLVGSGESGVVDGTGAAARLAFPLGIAVDGAGFVYVADADVIRRVSPGGTVVTIAGGDTPGFADGPAAAARFATPHGVAVDAAGALFIADRDNHRIRRLSPEGIVTTLAGTGVPGLADGPGPEAQFNAPYGVAVDAVGVVYVADALNHRIRRIGPDGMVSTLAGGGDPDSDGGGFADGPVAAARFSFPNGVAVDGAGVVYVADTYNARIRAITPDGLVRTVAGSGEDGGADGPALLAQFSDPSGVAVDASGTLYVVDKTNRVRVISPEGVVATLAGDGVRGFADGPAASSRFTEPQGVAVGSDGTVYVADTDNRRVRVVRPVP